MLRALLCLATLSSACGGWVEDSDGFTERDRELIESMVLPGEAPADPTNAYQSNGDAQLLGQALFFDSQLSNPPGVACADCHAPAAWFIDNISKPNNVSSGVSGLFTKRNSPSLVNVAHYRWWGWDGRADSLWMQCAIAYEAKATMSGSRKTLAEALNGRYRAQALRVFGDAMLSSGNDLVASLGYKAMAAYLARLNSAGAPFDAFAEGNDGALSPGAKKGLKLFLGKAGCIECHNGPGFNGNDTASSRDFFRCIGVAQRGEHVEPIDTGRPEGIATLLMKDQSIFNSGGIFNDNPNLNRVKLVMPGNPADVGRFRIKSLRQVAKTAPYMHAGQLSTLKDVMRFYNVGGDTAGFSGTLDRMMVPLGLTSEEEDQLVDFMEALTGRALPKALTCDTSLAPTGRYSKDCQ